MIRLTLLGSVFHLLLSSAASSSFIILLWGLAALFVALAMNSQVTIWEDSFETYPDFEIDKEFCKSDEFYECENKRHSD